MLLRLSFYFEAILDGVCVTSDVLGYPLRGSPVFIGYHKSSQVNRSVFLGVDVDTTCVDLVRTRESTFYLGGVSDPRSRVAHALGCFADFVTGFIRVRRHLIPSAADQSNTDNYHGNRFECFHCGFLRSRNGIGCTGKLLNIR